MKPLHLLRGDGSVRQGRASIDEIRACIAGRGNDKLVTISLAEDGSIVAVSLSDVDVAGLRDDLDRRADEVLRSLLDHQLAAIRCSAELGDVVTSGYMSIDLAHAPRAEAVVRAWADERAVFVKDQPVPPDSKSGKWSRSAEVTLTESSWSPTIVWMHWPEVAIDPMSTHVAEAVSVAIAAVGSEF